MKLQAVFSNMLPFPTLADKKTYYMLKVAERVDVKLLFNKDQYHFDNNVITTLTNYLKDEVELIEKVEKDWDESFSVDAEGNTVQSNRNLVENLHYTLDKSKKKVSRGNGFKFQLFTSLNDEELATNPATRREWLNKNSRDYIHKVLGERLHSELNKAVEIGLIEVKNGKYVNKSIPNNILDKYKSIEEYGNENAAIIHIIADNMINTMAVIS